MKKLLIMLAGVLFLGLMGASTAAADVPGPAPIDPARFNCPAYATTGAPDITGKLYRVCLDRELLNVNLAWSTDGGQHWFFQNSIGGSNISADTPVGIMRPGGVRTCVFIQSRRDFDFGQVYVKCAYDSFPTNALDWDHYWSPVSLPMP